MELLSAVFLYIKNEHLIFVYLNQKYHELLRCISFFASFDATATAFVAADIDDGFFRVVVICKSFIFIENTVFWKNRDRVNFALLANYRFIHSFYIFRIYWDRFDG